MVDIANFFCSQELVKSLIKAGVPANSKWGALILYMRSLSEYDYLSEEQKQQLQTLVVQAIKDRDYSEPKFKELVRRKEQILYSPWNKKLEEAFRETVLMVEHMRAQNLQRTKEVKDLRETTISTVSNQDVLEQMISEIRASFEKVITHMERDTQSLLEMSYTDPLTKLNNRRAFDSYLQTVLAEHLVTKEPLSFMLLDIDNFKNFNDTYGHRIGDQALVTVATKLSGYAKKYDNCPKCSFFPARYGGEEFVAVLPGIALAEAAQDAENLRGIIEDYNFIIRDYKGEVLQKGIKITVSIGVAELDTTWGDTAAALLVDKADKAMYRAKAGGRNMVCTMHEC